MLKINGSGVFSDPLNSTIFTLQKLNDCLKMLSPKSIYFWQ